MTLTICIYIYILNDGMLNVSDMFRTLLEFCSTFEHDLNSKICSQKS